MYKTTICFIYIKGIIRCLLYYYNISIEIKGNRINFWSNKIKKIIIRTNNNNHSYFGDDMIYVLHFGGSLIHAIVHVGSLIYALIEK